MKIKKSIKTLTAFNKWRRGDESIDQLSPKAIGEAIDIAIEALKLIDEIYDAFPEILKKNL